MFCKALASVIGLEYNEYFREAGISDVTLLVTLLIMSEFHVVTFMTFHISRT